MNIPSQFKHILPSLMVVSLFLLAPVAVSAHTSSSHISTGAVVTTNGFVRVAGATITAVTGNMINATTVFGSNILNWIINIDSDTKIAADGAINASTTALAVGDKIHFTGKLATTSGPALIVTAKAVYDATGKQEVTTIHGIVSAVSSSTNSFTLVTKKGAVVTVNTASTTTFKLNGDTGSFGSIAVGSTVRAKGTVSSNGSVLSATHVAVTVEQNDDDNSDDDDEDRKNSRHDGKRLGTFLKLNNFLSVGH